MTLTTLRLNAYLGPHIYSPFAGARLLLRAEADHSARLRGALKDGGQAIGLVLANLLVEARPAADGVVLEARFDTADPAVGAALCAYVAAGMRAELAGDGSWDADGPLDELRERRRAAAPPLAALQLLAEARHRGVPTARLPDGRLLLGQGRRGLVFHQAAPPAAPPWERLGSIPLAVVSGAALRAEGLRRAAAELARHRPLLFDQANADATLALLADPQVEAAVLGLDIADVLRRGVALSGCDVSVITDRAAERPAEADSDDEWLRAVGLPSLLGRTRTRVNLSHPSLAALRPYLAPDETAEW